MKSSLDIIHDGISYGSSEVSADKDGNVSYSFTLNAALDNAAGAQADFSSPLTGKDGTLNIKVVVANVLGSNPEHKRYPCLFRSPSMDRSNQNAPGPVGSGGVLCSEV